MSRPTNALLQHLVTRVQQDVQLLVDLGHVDAHYADSFLAQLPETQAPPYAAHNTGSQRALSGGKEDLRVTPARSVPAPPRNAIGEARALWAYNEGGKDKDLSFSAGDVIELLEENNEDWWTGRVHGREGLFPSNHVEKMINPRNLPPALAPPKKTFNNPLAGVFTSSNKLAPASRSAPPRMTNSLGLQEDPKNEARKAQKDALVGRAAHSAAGGIGAGAGAAIGGKLVRAIF